MASLILGGIGNAITPGLGMAASLVGGIGLSFAGRALASKKQSPQIQVTFGQHVQDVYLTGSSEGAPVRKAWGRMRFGGNVIWASNFKEWQENQVNWTANASSGKGGGGGTAWTPSINVIYHANLSFAVAFCEGGSGTSLGRVWADGKELDLAQFTWRFYNGSDQQLPDTFIESIEGSGNAPAYRGICYLVFENMVLDKFGNRMPQITAEIVRMPEIPDADDLTNCLRSVCMIPGLGEFVYGCQVYKADDSYGHTWVLNANILDQRADFSISLDQLAGANELPATAPPVPPYNLPWGGNPDPPTGGNWTSSQGALSAPDAVSLVVSWFGTDLRCGQCQIVPKVENASANVKPSNWQVANYWREGIPWIGTQTAPVVSHIYPSLFDPTGVGGSVSTVGGSVPAFGGTPSDDTVMQAIQEIKRRGLRCVFYPFVSMDVPPGNTLPDPYGGASQAVFPWRGRITCDPAPGRSGTVDKTSACATQVDAFFAQYNVMVLHYANLCVQAATTAALSGGTPAMVDAFIIGSELVGLTRLRSSAGDGTYPAVQHLKALAAQVRAILGPSVKIGYAADWSEYHSHRPGDGTNDVIFNMDPLWSDANIDFIGIDNYLPLSDWRDVGSNVDYHADGPVSPYDKSYLKANIEGGEYFDWYYASDADRAAQTRTPIVDGLAGKHWVFANKNIRAWWSSAHYSRPGGSENASPTAWVPQSKPIWFTEFGCPAVHLGSNQPNVFVDPKSSESFLPYFSNGSRDDAMQRAYLEAMLTYWRDHSPVSGGGVRMVDPRNMFVWCWDARPFPDFPSKNATWRDGVNYELGHWVSGRAQEVPVRWIIAELCGAVGLSDFDASRIVGPGSLSIGFASDGVVSPRDVLSGIEDAYQFDEVESDGKIVFASRGYASTLSLSIDDLVLDGDGDVGYSLTRAQETDLPGSLKLSFVDAYANYATSSATARRSIGTSERIATAQVGVVLESNQAQKLAANLLQQQWAARETAQVKLPPSKLALDPGDCLSLAIDGVTRSLRVKSIETGLYRALDLYGFDPALARGQGGSSGSPRSAPSAKTYGGVIVEFMDIPLLNSDDPKPWAPRIAAYASPWAGVSLYRSSGAGFALIGQIAKTAALGELTSPLYSGPRSIWDNANAVYLRLYDTSVQMLSLTELQTLSGLGAVAVKNPANGQWEILQFVNATLTGAGTYKLTKLLRAQQGTESGMADPVPAGARIVFLDASSLGVLDMTVDQRNVTQALRYGPSVYAITDASYAQSDFSFSGVGLRPYTPSHLSAAWQGSGDIALSWVRRTRFGGDSWEPIDAPLNEDAEAYQVDIANGTSIVRTMSAGAPSAVYSAAQQTADFGAPIASLTWTVYQISTIFGRGTGAKAVSTP
ncbi:putative tail protein [Methylosinus sp. sav-2]|uniref:baseplate multidomain protein megatron n=1 Tax=Methylosinus sp. sav-2 TaxID=2485168 RepID=UPI00047EA492|nr:glycoside hydrolase/phage tail family protein [Methylosinus sp. sav-2]TDX65144.1 putative tail protein [Methylosinus sp. sav-2]